MTVPSTPINLSPPSTGTWGRPLGLALIVHAAVVGALAWGVGSENSKVVFEAEVWSALPQVAAPRAVEPEAVPEPVVNEPPPPPEPTPAAPPPAPPAPPTPPPPKAQSPQVVTQKSPPKPEPKSEPRPPAKQAVEPDRAQQQQAQREAAERAARERAARERAAQEREAQRRAEQQRQAQQREREQQAQRDAERQRNLDRILGQANATGSTSATGQAAQSSGPSASYAGKLVGAIRPNIVFTGVVAGNPRAEVELRANPDGKILSARLLESSGSSAWDQAVMRAIERTGQLPLDENGRVPSRLILGFRPQD